MARTLEADLPPQQLTIAGTRKRRRFGIGTIALYVTLTLLALFFMVPLLWMLSTALKSEAAVFRDTGFIPAEPTLANFQRILTATSDRPVFR